MRNFRELQVWHKAHQLTLTLGYQTLDAQVVEVKKMLSAFIQKLRAAG